MLLSLAACRSSGHSGESGQHLHAMQQQKCAAAGHIGLRTKKAQVLHSQLVKFTELEAPAVEEALEARQLWGLCQPQAVEPSAC
jgi:hypothetical protein